MALIHVIAVALVLVLNTAWSSHLSESARDQYKSREDKPSQQLNEATDHHQKVHRFNLIKNPIKNNTIPELQVGCADGTIKEKPQEDTVAKKSRKRRSVQKRSYYPWSNRANVQVSYPSISAWKPPMYAIGRPYFIPIYGAPGRIPIYYPPQQLLINPGSPVDNPVKRPPFQGPTYLPPKPTAKPVIPDITNRFKMEDEEGNPIWDTETESPLQSNIPTRRPRPPGVVKEQPPLVHNALTSDDVQLQVSSSNIATSTLNRRTTTPPPAAGPSRCVWATISCCSSTTEIKYNCFEELGCPGAFWDVNPCGNEFARAAVASAANYFSSK